MQTLVCIHRIIKFGPYEVTKYLSHNEIHVRLKKQDEVLVLETFLVTDKSGAAKFYEDLVFQAKIYYTIDKRK